jgi:hypothetical protein
MLILSNFFFLHTLHHIFTGKTSTGIIDNIITMTKSYIHHIANFVFISNIDDNDNMNHILIITVIWRAISMSGHGAQYLKLKKYINDNELYQFNWILSHIRNITITIIIILCITKPGIRKAFGQSAIGHIGYILGIISVISLL